MLWSFMMQILSLPLSFELFSANLWSARKQGQLFLFLVSFCTIKRYFLLHLVLHSPTVGLHAIQTDTHVQQQHRMTSARVWKPRTLPWPSGCLGPQILAASSAHTGMQRHEHPQWNRLPVRPARSVGGPRYLVWAALQVRARAGQSMSVRRSFFMRQTGRVSRAYLTM